MIRLILLAAFIYFGYRLLKGPVGALLKGKSQPSDDEETSPADADLIKDPQCGVYFMKQKGVEARVDGRTLHFCSPACRDKYVKDAR